MKVSLKIVYLHLTCNCLLVTLLNHEFVFTAVLSVARRGQKMRLTFSRAVVLSSIKVPAFVASFPTQAASSSQTSREDEGTRRREERLLGQGARQNPGTHAASEPNRPILPMPLSHAEDK